MKISQIRIRKFRSIDDLSLDLGDFTALCGPNSCGKSNVFSAIRYALDSEFEIDNKVVYRNLPEDLRDQPGGPLLSTYIDIDFIDCPAAIQNVIGSPPGATVRYSFRAMRSGKVTRSVQRTNLSSAGYDELQRFVKVVYVPPIRDLSNSGLEPFMQLFGEILRKARGSTSMQTVRDEIDRVLTSRANAILPEHKAIAERLVGSQGLTLDTSKISVEHIFEQVRLSVDRAGRSIPLEELGTGHQSAFILHLFKQLGDSLPGDSIFLFEEPDNHLHPSTMRSIADDLGELSNVAQVLLSTHSPILLNAIPFSAHVSLYSGPQKNTQNHIRNLSSYSERHLKEVLQRFGIRATEPLLARRTLVVEGPGDAAAIAQLTIERHGKSPDELDLLIVPAGGKTQAVMLCKLLHAFQVDWSVLLDWDAVLTTSFPATRMGLNPFEQAQGIAAISSLLPLLATVNKSGIKAAKALRAIERELTNGASHPQLYTASCVDGLVAHCGLLTLQERTSLQSFLTANRKRDYRGLLAKSRIFLLPGTIEDEFLLNSYCERTVESELIQLALLPARSTQYARDDLWGRLHNLTTEPGVVETIVKKLAQGGKMRHSMLNKTVIALTDDIA